MGLGKGCRSSSSKSALQSTPGWIPLPPSLRACSSIRYQTATPKDPTDSIMELLCVGGRGLIGGRGSSRMKREVRLQFLDPDARADRPETTPSPPSRPNPPSSSLLKQHNNNNNNR